LLREDVLAAPTCYENREKEFTGNEPTVLANPDGEELVLAAAAGGNEEHDEQRSHE
jgi:hypothetical protein